MRSLLFAIATLATACTIDPVARAELSGAATGEAIFQRAGTSDQVSYQVTLAGADGTYDVYLDDGGCAATRTRWAPAGAIEVAGGTGVLRAVTQDWDVAAGDNDVVGRLVVVEQAAVMVSCGDIFNSD